MQLLFKPPYRTRLGRAMSTGIWLLCSLFLIGCNGNDSEVAACEQIDPSTYPLNMEMRQFTPPFPSRNVYGCERQDPLLGGQLLCTREQFEAIVTPPGWEKNAPNRILSLQNNIELFELDGVPSTVDFIDEIPGNEWQLIARVESVSLASGAPVAQVRRNTVFTFPACNRIHTLTDPDGKLFFMFAVIDDLIIAGLDIHSEYAFIDRQWPEGWTHDSFVPDEDIIVDSGGVATVYNHQGESTWQMVQ